MGPAHDEDPAAGKFGVPAQVALPLAGLAVIGRAVDLDVDHFPLEVPVEVDLSRRQCHRHLSAAAGQPSVVEHPFVSPYLELAVAARADELDEPADVGRAGGSRLEG